MAGPCKTVGQLALQSYFHAARVSIIPGGCFASNHNLRSLPSSSPSASSLISLNLLHRMYSKHEAYEPANLDLRSSAGSQAAQAATIGALTSAERGDAVDPSQVTEGGSSGDQADRSDRAAQGAAASDSNRHDGNLSLHSAMQSSVPDPYTSDNKSPNHMNMPAGGDLRQAKYSAELRQAPASADEDISSENTRKEREGNIAAAGAVGAQDAGAGVKKASRKERMKKAVKEYGATVVVFHTSISLCTLGIAYAAVSSGVDVVGLLSKIGVGQSILESKLATGTSTFVVAYACHKVFAPLRMATTLTATPFIVHYLRRVGVLKAPAPKK